MLGTVVNTLAIFIGSIIGVVLKEGLKERYKNILMQAVPLGVIIVGLPPAIATNNPLLFIISLVLGGLLGEFLGIEKGLENIGHSLEGFIRGDGNLAKGFVEASLIFCVGTMAILGSIEGGLNGNHTILYTKAILDGITSTILASTMGLGVFLSGFAVLLYQGSIALIASLLRAGIDPESMILHELSAVGGILIVCIGLNMLNITKIKVGNLLPAILIPVIYYSLFSKYISYFFG